MRFAGSKCFITFAVGGLFVNLDHCPQSVGLNIDVAGSKLIVKSIVQLILKVIACTSFQSLIVKKKIL